jgi:hypothetical protein
MKAILAAMLSGDDEKICRLIFEEEDKKVNHVGKYPVGYDHQSSEASCERYKKWYDKLRSESPEEFLALRKRQLNVSRQFYAKNRNDPEFLAKEAARKREYRKKIKNKI